MKSFQCFCSIERGIAQSKLPEVKAIFTQDKDFGLSRSYTIELKYGFCYEKLLIFLKKFFKQQFCVMLRPVIGI